MLKTLSKIMIKMTTSMNLMKMMMINPTKVKMFLTGNVLLLTMKGTESEFRDKNVYLKAEGVGCNYRCSTPSILEHSVAEPIKNIFKKFSKNLYFLGTTTLLQK